MTTTTVKASARPRVGVLGNPSDAYGGRVLAFTFEDFRADVSLAPCRSIRLVVGDATAELEAESGVVGWHRRLKGGASLLAATLEAFVEEAGIAPTDPRWGFCLEARSDIPRQVGLSGSSALVVAGLMGLQSWFGVPSWDPMTVARVALFVEDHLLGIAAGPQDRVVQAHGGFLDMDFGSRWSHVRLDPSALPPLLVVWTPTPGESSGSVHGDVRRRYLAGDPSLVEAFQMFRRLAAEGVDALHRRDHCRFMQLMNANFDQRATLFPIADIDREMVALGRSFGAAVKLCGSGGSVLVATETEAAMTPIIDAYGARGLETLRPAITETS